MSRKKIPSRQALVEALTELDGNMAAAGRRFHCDRRTVWHLVNDDPELRQLVNQLSESFTDEAEQVLFQLIREKNPAAVIFYLKTQGRDRGYSERLELLPLSRREIEVELGPTTLDTADQFKANDTDTTAVALLEQ
ncbi:hypothetical protein BH20ACI3_BH20ACI3_38870 [soil metagenome]